MPPSTVSYEGSYFFEFGLDALNAKRPLRDFRAGSVAAPLDLSRRSAHTWPPFLLDFLPQGRQAERIARTPRFGVSMADILERSDAFMEAADRFSMMAAGANGLQGDWPKVAMTQASDGLRYPGSFVADKSARSYVIVKMLRSGQATDDQRIPETEGAYSLVAKEFGLDVAGASATARECWWCRASTGP